MPFQVSVSFTGVSPPKLVPPEINPSVFVPAPLATHFEVLVSPTSVHEVPFQVSVIFVTAVANPPATQSAAVFVPKPAAYTLAVFKSVVSVHVEPFHDSLIDVKLPVAGAPSAPVKAKAEVLLAPLPAKVFLAVFKSATSVQETPS